MTSTENVSIREIVERSKQNYLVSSERKGAARRVNGGSPSRPNYTGL